EFPVEQGPPLGRDVGQEHTKLTVLDPPGGTGVLPLHTRGFGALLEKTRLIGHHHTAGITKVVQHVAAQIIAHRAGVPAVIAQQSLHTIRGQITGLLGQRPGVLPLRTRKQPQQIHPRPPTRVRLRETTSYQRKHVVEPGPPPRNTSINGHHVLSEFHHTAKFTTPRTHPTPRHAASITHRDCSIRTPNTTHDTLVRCRYDLFGA